MRQSLKSDRHKIQNIQIQVLIEHVDGLRGAAQGIGSIGLSIIAPAHIQDRVTIDRDQADLARFLMDRGDHDRVASVVSLQKVSGTGIHAKQGDIEVSIHHLVVFGLIIHILPQFLFEVHGIDALHFENVKHIFEFVGNNARHDHCDKKKDHDQPQNNGENALFLFSALFLGRRGTCPAGCGLAPGLCFPHRRGFIAASAGARPAIPAAACPPALLPAARAAAA